MYRPHHATRGARLVRETNQWPPCSIQELARLPPFAMTDADAPAAGSPDHETKLSPSTYDPRPASDADLAHAEWLLALEGMIPLTDTAGHRAAVHLWREHCLHASGRPLSALKAAVDTVLAAPRPTVNAHGSSLPAEYRWIRPSDVIITSHPDFPYHTTATGLAELAGRLIAEQGEPLGMHRILGSGLSVATYPRPGGRTHRISTNGNHRSAAIRAAGFPIALALSTVQQNPWTLGNPRQLRERPNDGIAYLRLLTRTGVLTRFDTHHDSHTPTAYAGRHYQWLIHGDPEAARCNLLRYEHHFGPLDGVDLDWIRNPDELERLITAERASMARTHPSPAYASLAEVLGQPLPALGRLEFTVARLRRKLVP